MSAPCEAKQSWLTSQLGATPWPLAAGFLYVALFLVVVLVSQMAPSPPRLCVFHWVTGHPCPTCGATRCWLALAQGHWLDAWRYNPLWFALTSAAGPFLAVWLYRRRRATPILGVFAPRPAGLNAGHAGLPWDKNIPQSTAWRWVLGIGFAVLFIANWIYLWTVGR